MDLMNNKLKELNKLKKLKELFLTSPSAGFN